MTKDQAKLTFGFATAMEFAAKCPTDLTGRLMTPANLGSHCVMGHRTDIKRADYYRREASTCARAALASAVADIKQAYLELEQGWLSLAPKPMESLNDLSVGEPGSDSCGSAPQPVSEKVIEDANRHRRHDAGRKLGATVLGSDQARNRYSPLIGRPDNNPTNPHLRRAGRNGRAGEARNS